MYNFNHEREAFEIDRSFTFSGGSATAEQREFDDWRRRIGGWIGGTATAARGRSDAPLVAKKGIAAAYRRIEPKVTRAAAAAAKPGMSPEKVCWIQNVLNKANGEVLAEDGAYGTASRAAVVRFQSGHGLGADGIVGPRTEVSLIQAALNQIAQAPLVPINGGMDPQTRQQIQSFQSANGLVADGIVGPKTRAAMVVALGGRCASRPAGSGPGTTKPSDWMQSSSLCNKKEYSRRVDECVAAAKRCVIAAHEDLGVAAAACLAGGKNPVQMGVCNAAALAKYYLALGRCRDALAPCDLAAKRATNCE